MCFLLYIKSRENILIIDVFLIVTARSLQLLFTPGCTQLYPKHVLHCNILNQLLITQCCSHLYPKHNCNIFYWPSFCLPQALLICILNMYWTVIWCTVTAPLSWIVLYWKESRKSCKGNYAHLICIHFHFFVLNQLFILIIFFTFCYLRFEKALGMLGELGTDLGRGASISGTWQQRNIKWILIFFILKNHIIL